MNTEYYLPLVIMLMTLPEFLSTPTDPEFLYLAVMLRDASTRDAIVAFLRVLMRDKLLSLKVTYLGPEATLKHKDVKSFTYNSVTHLPAFTTSHGPVMQYQHIFTKYGVQIKFPDLQCMIITNGLVKKWLMKGILENHTQFIPVELIEVETLSPFVQAHHVHRWGLPSVPLQPFSETEVKVMRTDPTRVKSEERNEMSEGVSGLSLLNFEDRPRTPETPDPEILDQRRDGLITKGGFGSPRRQPVPMELVIPSERSFTPPSRLSHREVPPTVCDGQAELTPTRLATPEEGRDMCFSPTMNERARSCEIIQLRNELEAMAKLNKALKLKIRRLETENEHLLMLMGDKP